MTLTPHAGPSLVLDSANEVLPLRLIPDSVADPVTRQGANTVLSVRYAGQNEPEPEFVQKQDAPREDA